MKSNDKTQVFTTTVWSAGAGCHGGCGQKLYVEDGRLVKVEGDENHPWNQGRSCPRVLALKQYMYHPDRVIYPHKRVGARGEGKWERISWDEAFDTCVTRLNAIRDKYGPESVVFAQGTGRDVGGPISFLCYSFGSPNWAQLGLSGQSCYTPRLGVMKAVFGDFWVTDMGQFSPQRYNDPEYKRPEQIVVWAQNPPNGCPDAFLGHWIVDAMKMGSKIVTVDPRQTWMTTRSDEHLQIRPGTDAALALGMLHVIINENLYDKDFVANYTHGFDQLKERVQEYSPQRVEGITWVPADQIVRAARKLAEIKPTAFHWGVPIDMNPEATHTAHAICCLMAVLGNVDIPGGNVLARGSFNITTYPWSTEELYDLYGEDLVKQLNEKRIGADVYGFVRDFRGWAHPDMCIEQMMTGKPYPIKGLWLQTANVVAGQAVRARYHYEAMKRMEFVAAVDLFHNPTTMALADIILPAATFAEKDSFRAWWAPCQVIHKCVQVGECKSDWEINFELAKRLNPKGLPWPTLKDFFNERLQPADITFDELVKQDCVKWPPKGHNTVPYHRHEKGLLRKDGEKGFTTKTGKVELYCTQFEEWGLDPLPYHEFPAQCPERTPELCEKYPLVMISGTRSQLFFHSEHRMIPWLREKMPWPTVDIHPETAKKYDVYQGEWVYLENEMGQIRRKVNIDKTVLPKCINTSHGWWMPEEDGAEPNLYGVWEYQINKINPGPQFDVAGFGGGQYKVTHVTITKITNEQAKTTEPVTGREGTYFTSKHAHLTEL